MVPPVYGMWNVAKFINYYAVFFSSRPPNHFCKDISVRNNSAILVKLHSRLSTFCTYSMLYAPVIRTIKSTDYCQLWPLLYVRKMLRVISSEYIALLHSYFRNMYLIIKHMSSSVKDKVHR